MVKLGRLWGDAKFASLSPLSKLVYCYLLSQPSISTLGVLDIFLGKIALDTGTDIVGHTLTKLEEAGLVALIPNDVDNQRYQIIVLDHFKSIPKSKSNLRKAIDEGKSADGGLKDVLRLIFTEADAKDDSFKAPTPDEVSEFALTLGFIVNGRDFVNYYGDNDWYDKNNKKVRNWKSKVRKVWCRETNKLEKVDGAPKGFDFFFVETVDGDRIYPQSWKHGLPSHSNHVYAHYLIEGFNEQKNS